MPSDPLKLGLSILGLATGAYIFIYVKNNFVRKCPPIPPASSTPTNTQLSCRSGAEVLNLGENSCEDVCVNYPALQKDIVSAANKISGSLDTVVNGILEAFREMEKVPEKINYNVKLPWIKGFGDIVKPAETVIGLLQSCPICDKFCEQTCGKTCKKWCPLPFGCKELCKNVVCGPCNQYQQIAQALCKI